jgi:hypothetical protein
LAKAEEMESTEVVRDVESLQIQDNLLLKIEKSFSNTGLNLLYIIFFPGSLSGRESLQIHLKSIAYFLLSMTQSQGHPYPYLEQSHFIELCKFFSF